jgi:hypothetical protein
MNAPMKIAYGLDNEGAVVNYLERRKWAENLKKPRGVRDAVGRNANIRWSVGETQNRDQ